MGSSDSILAASLRDWAPAPVSRSRRVGPWPAEAFAGLIGTPAPPLRDGGPLPPLWHWFTLLEHPATSEIGADGHPATTPRRPRATPAWSRRNVITGQLVRRGALG
jgi:3-methylfumaryl-CoA hydratase